LLVCSRVKLRSLAFPVMINPASMVLRRKVLPAITGSISAILSIKEFRWEIPEPEFVGIRLANILAVDELALYASIQPE
jgi:hypothetical protein